MGWKDEINRLYATRVLSEQSEVRRCRNIKTIMIIAVLWKENTVYSMYLSSHCLEQLFCLTWMYLFLKNSVSFLFCVAVFLIRFKKEEGMHTPPLYTFSFFYNNEYCNSWPFILRPCLLLSLGRQRIMHKRKLYRRTSLLFCLCHFVWIFSKHSTYCTVQTP